MVLNYILVGCPWLEPLGTAKLEIAYCAKTHKSTDRDFYLLETMLTESHDRVLQRNTLSVISWLDSVYSYLKMYKSNFKNCYLNPSSFLGGCYKLFKRTTISVFSRERFIKVTSDHGFMGDWITKVRRQYTPVQECKHSASSRAKANPLVKPVGWKR